MAPYSVAIIGVGKIAVDEHLPAVAADPDFRLAGLVSGRGVTRDGVPTFRTAAELYRALPDLDAVSICTPPGAHYGAAREALDAGVAVLLEKPPTATVAELADLGAHAAARGRVLFTTWHSQYNPAVDEAASRLRGQRVTRLHITWKEDVRRWHPGQAWIWEAAGFGVFDPGINALSILTRIFPGPVFVRDAVLTTPKGRLMPIAAELTLHSPLSPEAALTAEFDWRQTGPQTWTVAVETADGDALTLTNGGAALAVNGETIATGPRAEYPAIYRRFAGLLRAGDSAVDVAPFQLVADAFMVGRRVETEPFED